MACYLGTFSIACLAIRRDLKIYEKNGDSIQSRHFFLLKNNNPIYIDDLGARKSRKAIVKEIAAHSLKEPKHAAILGKLVEFFDPKSVLEFGTSLGISTAYLAQNETKVFTIEGSEEIQNQAKEVWRNLDLTNIHSYLGSFDDLLEEIWPEIEQPSMIFLDGN